MIKEKKILALIPARGGSKGVPGKNIKKLGRKPLIAYTIEAARNSRYIDDVVVTTDDEQIAKIAKEFGAQVPFMRPAELALDTSATIECVVHARDELLRQGKRYDYLVLLQPTSPLRESGDIDSAIEMFVEHGCEGIASVSPVEQNPVLIRSKDVQGRLCPLLKVSSTVRRQDMPEYYCVNGSIYINKSEELTLSTSLNDNPIGYVMRCSHAVDIDTIDDFKKAERIIQESGGSKEGANNITMVAPSLRESKKEIVIFGTGRMALLAFTALLQEDIEVSAFCGDQVDIEIMGKKVISPDDLRKKISECTVVYAGENLTSMEEDMSYLGVSKYWVDIHAYSIVNDCVWSFM